MTTRPDFTYTTTAPVWHQLPGTDVLTCVQGRALNDLKEILERCNEPRPLLMFGVYDSAYAFQVTRIKEMATALPENFSMDTYKVLGALHVKRADDDSDATSFEETVTSFGRVLAEDKSLWGARTRRVVQLVGNPHPMLEGTITLGAPAGDMRLCLIDTAAQTLRPMLPLPPNQA